MRRSSTDFSNRSRQRALWRPSIPKDALTKAFMIYPCYLRPFSYRMSHAIVSDCVGTSPVICLFGFGRPTAIFRAIVAIVINPINRVIRRGAESHICKEVLKGVTPALANRDASSSIPFVSNAIRVLAARLHALPGMVFSRVMPTMLARIFARLGYHLKFETTTTFRIPTSEISRTHDSLPPTFAEAQPFGNAGINRSSLGRSDIANDSQPAKLLTSNIFDVSIRYRDDLGYSGDGHCKLPLLCSGRGRSQKSFTAIFVSALTPIIAQMSGVS